MIAEEASAADAIPSSGASAASSAGDAAMPLAVPMPSAVRALGAWVADALHFFIE